MLPMIAYLSINLSILISGDALIEYMYEYPGLGQYLSQAVTQGDFPVIEGCLLVIIIVVVAANLITDIMYTVIDPRIKLE